MVVFCPVCETTKSKQSGVLVVQCGRGTPSAVAIEKGNGEKVVFCFNCSTLTVILETVEQHGFMPETDELIHTPHKYLNYNGRVDVDLNQNAKLIFVDAPMGTGKTELVTSYLENLSPYTRILAISFRQSLAKYLARRWNLACYLEPGFWSDPLKMSRCTVCLDSIYKLPPYEPYDLVILDEGTFIQYHFTSGTIESRKMEEVIEKFKLFIQTSGKVSPLS